MMPDVVCDVEACRRQAVWVWHAQWTIADFGEWYACIEHWKDVGVALSRRTVDGEEVQDLYSDKLFQPD